MDVESRLLLYAVVFGCGVALYYIVRRRAVAVLRVHAGLMAALLTAALAALISPRVGEAIALPVIVAFCALAMLPSMLVVAARRLFGGRHFRAAGLAARLGALLLGLPAPIVREARLYDALAASDARNVEEARRRLRRLVADGGLPPGHGGSTLAEALPLAGARRWPEALAAIDAAPSSAPAVLAIEARAAAETGDLRRALGAARRLERRSQATAAEAAARRAVLAAAGRVEVLAEAERRRWPVVRQPRGVGALVLGRAHEVRGETDEAARAYGRAARRGARAVRREARDRLAALAAAPAASSVPALDEIQTDELLRLEERCRRDARAAESAAPPRAWATWALSVLTALVSATVTLRVGDDGFGLLRQGALSAPLVAGEGQWWRLFTAMLLHGGWIHLILNLGCILPVGVLVERRVGAARTLVIYLGSGLVGSLASVYLNATDIGVGASGAAMGLIGALGTLLKRRPGMFGAAERGRWLGLIGMAVVATAAIGVLEHSHVDNAAHFAGLLAGALIAALALPPASGAREPLLRRVGARLGAALLVALLAAAAVESARESASWSEVRRVNAGGAVVELPGWLGTRALPDGSVVAERRPAEIALQIGSRSSAQPRPRALLPDDAAWNVVRAALPETMEVGSMTVEVPRAALDAGVATEFGPGVRFRLFAEGDAFVLVRLPDDPEVERAYDRLLQGVRDSLRDDAASRELDDDGASSE